MNGKYEIFGSIKQTIYSYIYMYCKNNNTVTGVEWEVIFLDPHGHKDSVWGQTDNVWVYESLTLSYICFVSSKYIKQTEKIWLFRMILH